MDCPSSQMTRITAMMIIMMAVPDMISSFIHPHYYVRCICPISYATRLKIKFQVVKGGL
jgi:hypothetical protein